MNTSRRSFLKAAAAVSLFNIVPAHVLRGETAPSNQITRALIGFGGIAASENHLGFKGSRLIGLCDPDQTRVQNGLVRAEKAGWGKVKAYENFIKLLEDPDVDVVHICTPPHWQPAGARSRPTRTSSSSSKTRTWTSSTSARRPTGTPCRA